MAAENETGISPLVERFIATYGTGERGTKLWEQWMETQPDAGKTLLEQLAENEAEERHCSIEEARARLAIQKLVTDRGEDYAAKYLTRKETAERWASQPLKPMSLTRKKK